MFKYYIIFLSQLLLCTLLYAQKPGQLYLTSYDNKDQPVFFCEGVRQNEVDLKFGLANLLSSTDPDFIVDSVVFFSNSKGSFVGRERIAAFPMAGMGVFSAPTYVPNAIGDDTLIIIGYYGGYTSSASIICHAIASPAIGMLGYTSAVINLGGGNAVYPINLQVEVDTVHDDMNNGSSYRVSSTPQSTGWNKYAQLRACETTLVDSISFVGDFTEFSFYDLPQFPTTLNSGDSLLIKYQFIPHIVGKSPHFLIFHVHKGNNLVWSFEYGVKPNADVSDESHSDLDLSLFPNPATNELHLSFEQPLKVQDIQVFNAEGRVLQSILDIPQFNIRQVKLNTQSLPPGMYFVQIALQNAPPVIRRFLVQH